MRTKEEFTNVIIKGFPYHELFNIKIEIALKIKQNNITSKRIPIILTSFPKRHLIFVTNCLQNTALKLCTYNRNVQKLLRYSPSFLPVRNRFYTAFSIFECETTLIFNPARRGSKLFINRLRDEAEVINFGIVKPRNKSGAK